MFLSNLTFDYCAVAAASSVSPKSIFSWLILSVQFYLFTFRHFFPLPSFFLSLFFFMLVLVVVARESSMLCMVMVSSICACVHLPRCQRVLVRPWSRR